MKIAFLSPFYPYRGGIAQFSDSLYIELAKEHEVKALTFTKQYPSILFPGKTQYVSDDDLNRNIPVTRILNSINPLTWNKTAREIIDFKPDVVLISYWMPFFAPAFGKIASRLQSSGIKVIGVLHNVIAHEKRAGDIGLTKYFFNKCDGFIILNNSSEKDLLGLIPDAKYKIHPHPLYDHYGEKINSDEARARLDIPLDKKVILFFGFIRDYKGLDMLIDSMKDLNDDYLLLIAGEVYGDFKKYDERIDKLGIGNKINLQIKYIPEKDISLYFSAADVCVLPYRSATQSGIVGIAYHFELPVIVTNVGGLAEMVDEDKTGIVVNDIDARSIASAIQKYFNEGMKQNCIPNIIEYKQEHSWKAFADDVILLTESLK